MSLVPTVKAIYRRRKKTKKAGKGDFNFLDVAPATQLPPVFG